MLESEIRLNIMDNLAEIMGTGNHPKISCKELSEKSGVPYHTVRSLRFRGVGGIFTLCKIADALHVTVDELVNYKG